jgi:hypothetical protein
LCIAIKTNCMMYCVILPLSQISCHFSIPQFSQNTCHSHFPMQLAIFLIRLYLSPACFLCTYLFHLTLILVSKAKTSTILGRRDYLLALIGRMQLCRVGFGSYFRSFSCYCCGILSMCLCLMGVCSGIFSCYFCCLGKLTVTTCLRHPSARIILTNCLDNFALLLPVVFVI